MYYLAQGGGGTAEPVAERHPHLDPCVCTTNLAKTLAGYSTTKMRMALSACHPELRERAECVARNARRHVSCESSKTVSGSVKRDRKNATLVLRLALNATARACCRKRGFASRALISPLRSVAPLGLAFTMAEILLSLTIIGVVAAITLPSLTGNINERTWNTQRKALYARMSQAISLMPAMNGYGTGSDNESDIQKNATQAFVTSGLAKVLKINNVCDAEHLQDCGITSKMINLKGETISPFPTTLHLMNSKFAISSDRYSEVVSIINTDAAAFETANGESVLVFYNPYCRSDLDNQAQTARRSSLNCMCVNFVYDLNGTKGPNTVGKDINFISVLYPADSEVVSVSPVGYARPAMGKQTEANKFCQETYSETRAPNYDEGAAVFFNMELIGNLNAGDGSTNGVFWTNKPYSATNGWVIQTQDGARTNWNSKELNYSIYCIKRPN